jgi:eukaryotic-like serine/threonine-protein kinase
LSAKEQIMVREGPRDAAALARELVRYSRLTPYQAAAVLQGKTKGLLIGNYVVLDKLGAGSMGIVFKARNRVLKRLVALKLLPPSLARDQSAVSRFQREAKAAAKLSHPNVVAVLDADEFRGLHFLVMEYVLGPV